MSLDMSGAKGVSSPPANTVECDAMMASTSVLPERGMPMMKMGASEGFPDASRFHVVPFLLVWLLFFVVVVVVVVVVVDDDDVVVVVVVVVVAAVVCFVSCDFFLSLE